MMIKIKEKKNFIKIYFLVFLTFFKRKGKYCFFFFLIFFKKNYNLSEKKYILKREKKKLS
jgi:hypothetical protein